MGHQHFNPRVTIATNIAGLQKTICLQCGEGQFQENHAITFTEEFLIDQEEFIKHYFWDSVGEFVQSHPGFEKILQELNLSPYDYNFDPPYLNIEPPYFEYEYEPFGFSSSDSFKDYFSSSSVSHSAPLEVHKLPGLSEKVTCPWSGRQEELKVVIINLNDKARWTRQEIADWLETLDIDLRFGA